jgi:phosphatidate cytidylyltransferase
MTLVVMAAFCAEIRRYEGPGAIAERLGATVFCVAYVGLLLGFIVQLRTLGDGRFGIAAIVSLVFVVKASDTGAYTAGRLFGRRKLAPRLSPGKTVEGVVGGVALALLASWLSLRVLPAWLLDGASRGVGSSADWIIFGLLLSAAGVLGDLAESLLKRDAGRKDSSDWLPGLGGVLDMLDSVLMAAPVAYWFWTCRLVGT